MLNRADLILLREVSDDLRREIDSHDSLQSQSLCEVFESLVVRAIIVVVLHVLHTCKLGLGHQGEALRPRIGLGWANSQV